MTHDVEVVVETSGCATFSKQLFFIYYLKTEKTKETKTRRNAKAKSKNKNKSKKGKNSYLGLPPEKRLI